MNEPLSPAAEVMIAYWKGQEASQQLGVAAALEAVADQVVYFPGRYPLNEYMEGMREAKREVREKLLFIAAELRQ